MNYLIMTIVSLFGLFLYQYSKRRDAEANGLISNTKGQDHQLEKQELNVKHEVDVIDERLKAIKKQREDNLLIQNNMSLEERANDANKKFGGN